MESQGSNSKKQSRVSEAVMWLLSNIALNSMPDLDALLDSNILTNVALVCIDTSRNVARRNEAVNTLCDIVVKLANEN